MKERACLDSGTESGGQREPLMEAGQGRLGDAELPGEPRGHSVPGRRNSRGQGQQVAMVEGSTHPVKGGQGTGRGHPSQGSAGLRAESGLCFMDNERPLKGAKQKQHDLISVFKAHYGA